VLACIWGGGKERFGGIVTNRILAYQIVTMIKKTENCLYCGEKMESKTAKKKFCSTLHRVYYNRELANKILSETKKTSKIAAKIEKKVEAVENVVSKLEPTVKESAKGLTSFQIYQRQKLGLK